LPPQKNTGSVSSTGAITRPDCEPARPVTVYSHPFFHMSSSS
jgi:hypothetical protein